MSILIQDAGGEYVWQNDSTSGSLKLSFEDVYSRCNTSDIWLGVADFSSLESLKNEDSRYADFRAFENGSVYNYTLRTTEQGGNDYFETGYLRPDLVLKDMASIFNSSLYSDYKSYFYKKLE